MDIAARAPVKREVGGTLKGWAERLCRQGVCVNLIFVKELIKALLRIPDFYIILPHKPGYSWLMQF